MNNNLDTRIQHAVIGETNNAGKTTATDDIPLKGEIIFNSTLDNFRVGNGSNAYSALDDFIGTAEAWTFTTAAGVTVIKHVLVQ